MKYRLKIKEIRLSKKMSLVKLAKESRISKSYLSEIENNIKLPTLGILYKISNALDVSPHELFSYKYKNRIIMFLPFSIYKKLKILSKKNNCSINSLITNILCKYINEFSKKK